MNTQGQSATITGFEAFGNATVVDAWLHVSDSPMAASTEPSIVWDIGDIANGTLDGTTTDLISGFLSLEDDESISIISDFDDGGFTMELGSDYAPGPAPVVVLGLQNAFGYSPHPHCNNLLGYNLTSGFDEDGNGNVDHSEVVSITYLCQTNHTVQGGNGNVANGTVVNGTILYSSSDIAAGNATCPEGGEYVVYGNDYGYYYDSNTALNSSEVDGEYYFCDRPTYWEATVLNLGGVIDGQNQTLAHGVVPSTSKEGSVVVATLPGSPLPAGVDTWLTLPVTTTPSAALQVNYKFSFNHWFHLDGSEAGAWIEYRAQNSTGWGDWTWIEPTGGYPYSISNSSISVNGASPSALPVFSGSTYSGWMYEELDITNIPDISNVSDVQFRFRVWTSDSASPKPGWYIDNAIVRNDGTGIGAWHHGCDLNGYHYGIGGTSGTQCLYANNVIGNLVQANVNLTNVATLQFDLHWDLEGSGWDNACIELGSAAGTNWVDISSTGTTSTAIQCRSRSGAIPSNGYSDMNGQSYSDDSGGAVTIELDVPVGKRINNAQLKIVVQTDSSVQYGSPYGSDPDGREGLTVYGYRGYNASGVRLFEQIYSHNTNVTTSATGTNEWRFLNLNSGYFQHVFGFDDSTASDPVISDILGFIRYSATQDCTGSSCQFELGFWDSFGPEYPASFPYSYAFGGDGSIDAAVTNVSLTTPLYDVPMTGLTEFTFDHWACFDYYNYMGGALFMKVNSGDWQHYDPGWYTNTMYAFGTVTALDGLGIWTTVDCGSDYFSSQTVDLSTYRGDSVQFKFVGASKYLRTGSGWFIDNVGLRQANFSQPGTWLSPEFAVGQDDLFDWGMIEIDGKSDDNGNNTITGTLLDSSTLIPIPGYSDVEFPISLAGLDTTAHPQLRLRVNLDTQNPSSTPMIEKIRIGGSRLLSADMSEINGWQLSNSVVLIDGTLNASSVSGTITSDYIHSQRPIRGLSFSGNTSSNVYIEAFDSSGASLGSAPKGGSVLFTTPQSGFSLEVSLPTNAYINRLDISPQYGEPARDVVIDATEDGSVDWSFPFSSGRGHYAWQTQMVADQSSLGSGQAYDSMTLNIGASGTSVYSIVPVSSYVNSGLLSVSSDSDGFESPVTISVAGTAFSTGSESELFTSAMTSTQLLNINSLGSGWTDSGTNRDWRVIDISLSSTTSQQVTISGLAMGYSAFENVSGLGQQISDYHEAHTQDDPPPVEIGIPFNVTTEMGAVSIDGTLDFDYFLTNRDFQVPETLYPDGNMIEIVTKHHHLDDNSQISVISLTGIASDGQTLEFTVVNSQDGLWGQGSKVTFDQNSGASVAPLDTSSSYVEILTHNDGHDDVVVHWMFSINWNWDDVDTINWVSKAMNAAGETVWPAAAVSGQSSGTKAVENDLQIESFEVRDSFDRLLSNQYSDFYPFPYREGDDLNITGTVRFQDAADARPAYGDFEVGLNMSGNLFSLSTGDAGSFSGIITPPESTVGLPQLSLSPLMISVGPSGLTVGAEDTTGHAPPITVRTDSNPPVTGPIQVNTPTGLNDAHGKVWDPSIPLSVFVTVDEVEARGDLLTLRYWRESVDDVNMDGIADEEEYMSQHQPLSPGLTGQQQINFAAIDVSSQSFNSPVHMYIEGTDYAGWTYQDGGTGGGPSAANSWSTVIVAVDEPTNIISDGFELDDHIGYLLAGSTHTFSMKIDELNGINSLENITIALCGDDPTNNLGKFSYDPSRGTLWSATDSMVSPLSAQTSQLTSAITELSLTFKLSWSYPWEEGQHSCKPSVDIVDDLVTVAYQNNIGELSWDLDNKLTAVPSSAEDLTPPIVEPSGNKIYLQQGDEFTVEGSIYYYGSQVLATEVPSGLDVELEVIYGTQEVDTVVNVDADGTFSGSLVLPARVPLNPEMVITTNVHNIPGLGTSGSNTDMSVVVDSKAPQVLFNIVEYPNSSLTLLDSDTISEVLITVTMVDEIGMNDGPLQVSWVFVRDNSPVPGTEDSGELAMISDGETNDVYQSTLDMVPQNAMNLETGDYVWFWVTSTDMSGNEIIGPGSESAPRQVTLRIMEFLGEFTRAVINPTVTPVQGDILTIETFWENSGKREGEIVVGLYELDGGSWIPSFSTLRDGDLTLTIPVESSSIYAEFQWESWKPGQPNLYLIIDGNFEDPYQAITGINVQPPAVEEEAESESQMLIIGGVLVIVVLGIAMSMIRGRDSEDYYYEDDEEEYYEDGSWEISEGESEEAESEEVGADEEDG